MAVVHLLLLLFLLHCCSTPTSCYDPPIHHLCEKGVNYTANSTFHSNLITLLASLTNATTAAANSTFRTDAVGSSPDRVYGLFLCRGDVGLPECQACIQTASRNATLLCDPYRKATVWYDSCQLRYSDTDFFGTFRTDSFAYGVQNVNQTDPDAFGRMEQRLTGALATSAYNSSLMFATGSLWYNKDLPSIYGLVQCTRDLSPDGCGQCLQQAFHFYSESNFQARRGGRVLRKACNFRYETYNFYDGEPTVALNMSSTSSSSPTAASTSTRPAPAPASLSSPIPTKQGKKNGTGKVVAILISTAAAFAVMVTLFICFRRWRSPKNIVLGVAILEEIKSEESILIDLSILKTATNNFSDENKLGEGGFGAVYKGTLLDGQAVAVKRLSSSSKQGIRELKNELLLVAKLQYKNLVRLRGVCLEEEESLLVYEYVPNRSLDTILFDCTKREELNWERRFEIIGGIARGLRYLHEESHLRVVHRDLKASNVLLDSDMNPKISDFGLARLFEVDEMQCYASRVVGTFGYMAPEYAMRGRVSVKSDVFSFGVMVLEIVTGKKNSSFEEEHAQGLLSYVWEHWSAETALEIVDTSLREQFSRDEVLRCIQVGLLCLQDVAANRPLMSMVVLMLQSPSMALQPPLQPTYGVGGRSTDTDSSTVKTQSSGLGSADILSASKNDVTITELHPR